MFYSQMVIRIGISDGGEYEDEATVVCSILAFP